MKNLRCLYAILLILYCSFCYAHDFRKDGIYYNVTDTINKTVEITYKGLYPDQYIEYIDNIIIPENVTYNGVNYSVTRIGREAFAGCTGLTCITIPSSITYLGYDAFEDCSGLREVHITDLYAWCNIDYEISSSNPLNYAHNLYLDGKKVTELVIPYGITEIKFHLFGNCTSITSIRIPNSVTSIQMMAFMNCSGLTSVEIPNSVTSIGISAFENCSSLTSITIPGSVKRIHKQAFWKCYGLREIHITDLDAWKNISFDDYANPLNISGTVLYLNGEEI